MTRIIITHVDGVTIAKVKNGSKLGVESAVRNIRAHGFDHKGTHYGPASIVKIEVKHAGQA